MRIKLLIGTALAVAGLLAGCGGGGSKSSSQSGSLRTLMGYVYVKDASNVNATDPDVIITPASTPPAEPHKYNIPTGGKVTLIVENGTFLQKVPSGYNGAVFTKDLSTGNDIIVNVQLDPGGQVNVAGSGITSGSDSKLLEAFVTPVNDGKPSGTTALLRSPKDPETRTPDSSAISEVKFTLDGVTPKDPNDLIAGDRKFLGIGYVDVNGLAVPGVPSIGSGVTITSSAPAKVQVNKTDNILTTAVKGQVAGDVTINVSVNAPSSASGELKLNYNFGEPANVAIYRKLPSGLTRLDNPQISPIIIRWDVTTDVRQSNLPSSMLLVAEITNKYGAAIPDLQVNWSDVKAPGNVWNTTSGGHAFVDPNDDEVPAPTTTTDTNGQTVVRFSSPTPVDGPLSGAPGAADPMGDPTGKGDQFPKALNYVFATVNGTSAVNKSPAKVYVTRQFSNVVVAESQTSKYYVVNAYTRVPYSSYATDVDGWESRDSYVVKWKSINTLGGHKVGDPGERELSNHLAPTAVSYMEGNVLVTGNIAGEAQVIAYTDDIVPVESKPYRVQIWGPPSQIACSDGPQNYDPKKPWEIAVLPDGVLYGLPASQLVNRGIAIDPDSGLPYYHHFQANGDTPPKLVAYMYFSYIDTWGNHTIIPPTMPAGNTWTATYSSPFNNGGIDQPSTPLGSKGARCMIVYWGPDTHLNGEIAIAYTGTWYGVVTDAPPPSTAVPFSVSRRIRVNNE